MNLSCVSLVLIVSILACWSQGETVVPIVAEPLAPEETTVKIQNVALPQKVVTPEREAVITADRIEFDNKEGVILFDNNVFLDDAQFILHSSRLLVFMEGTNDVQQIMAIGSVNITNENRSASCDKAVYTKKNGQIVMTGNARLIRQGDAGGEVTGTRITFWLDDERMEILPGRVVLAPVTFNKGGKNLIP